MQARLGRPTQALVARQVDREGSRCSPTSNRLVTYQEVEQAVEAANPALRGGRCAQDSQAVFAAQETSVPVTSTDIAYQIVHTPTNGDRALVERLSRPMVATETSWHILT